MSDKISFTEMHKLYVKHMEDCENNFFASGSHGWNQQDFIQMLEHEQKMTIEYYNAIKPLIDQGIVYLN